MAANKTTIKPKSTGKKGFFSHIMRFFWKLIIWFNIVSLFFVVLYKFVPVPYTPLMVIRYFENKSAGKNIETKHHWVPLENISKNLQKAVIASEDGRFFEHYGLDFSAMQKAAVGNFKGKKLKGGSTITQQTAKNVFLWQGRSYFRKALEAYYTVLIELIWGKERILEVYLNSIEMGDGIYGAEAATQHWYKKECKSLTRMQAAGIAAILPNPRRFSPNGSAYISRKQSKIARYILMTKLKY
ncbi:monofunctional biosynthetic peptidoglycan transglycosylase [Flavobacterium sp.]|jgi:monofunctional biosynthetic peptidoglycan transglycosylase|uniref:monofunctional biosynthetic peptidoglycan transglycosylase n=1 Tax=Flavobacterium sp. TaxID=239 RepID=UPI0037C00CF3